MKASRIFLLSFCIIIFFILTFASEQQKAKWKGKTEYENGAKVIKNPKEPLYGEITLELEKDLSIGNEEDEEYAFFDGVKHAVDSKGNFIILDIGNYRVQKFDRNGNYLLTIGRDGQRPREFQQPMALHLDSNDNIFVEDSRRKIQIFNSKGDSIKTITLTDSARPIFFQFGNVRNGNIIALTYFRDTRKLKKSQDYSSFFGIDIISDEGKLIKTITEYPQEFRTPTKIDERSLWLDNLCTPKLYLCPINEEVLIYGHSSKYRLFSINSLGELVFIIEKDENPHLVTKDDKDGVLNLHLQRRQKVKNLQNISKRKYKKALQFPIHKPYFKQILNDDKGRIYIERFKFPFEKTEITDYDLFCKNGHYLYHITIPISFLLGRKPIIKDGFIYTTEKEEETGYSKVIRHKIKNWDQIKEGI